MKLILPVPPSTNNLFINVPGRGRVIGGEYQRWRKAAQDSLWEQKREVFDVPVVVIITVPDKGRRDADNYSKACLDFLVQQEMITDDSRKYVRRLTVQFGDVEQCEVEVTPA